MLDVQIRTEQHASAGDSMDCFLTHGRGIMAAMCMHGSRESRKKKTPLSPVGQDEKPVPFRL